MRLDSAKIEFPSLMLSVHHAEVRYKECIFASNVACISIDIVDAPSEGVLNQFTCSTIVPSVFWSSQLDGKFIVVVRQFWILIKVDC